MANGRETLETGSENGSDWDVVSTNHSGPNPAVALGATAAHVMIHGALLGPIPDSGYSLAGAPVTELVQNQLKRAPEEEEDFADLTALKEKGKVPGLSGNTLDARADGVKSPEGLTGLIPSAGQSLGGANKANSVGDSSEHGGFMAGHGTNAANMSMLNESRNNLSGPGNNPSGSGKTLGTETNEAKGSWGLKAAFPGRFRSSRASSVVSQDESPLQETVVYKVFQPIPVEQRASESQQPAQLSGEETAPTVHCFKCRKSGHMAYHCTESKDKARQRDYERRSNHIEIGRQFYANERIIKERTKVDQRLGLRSAHARHRDELDDINRRHLDESRAFQDGFDERKRQAFAPPR